MGHGQLGRVSFIFITPATLSVVSTLSLLWRHSPQLLFGPYDWNPPSGTPIYCSWDGPKTKNCNTHHFNQGLIHLAHTAGAEGESIMIEYIHDPCNAILFADVHSSPSDSSVAVNWRMELV